MYEIVIGRNQKDREKYGLKGTMPIAKHYVKMGQTSSLANKVLIDAITSHVIFICGKRGSGKSYTMGVLAEGLGLLEPEIKQNIATLIFDTMGVFWTMKYKNKQDEKLLEEWDLHEEEFKVKVLVPEGKVEELKEQNFPVDGGFSISLKEMTPEAWCDVFEIDPLSEVGAFIQRIITEVEGKETFKNIYHQIKILEAPQHIKLVTENLFKNAEKWGLFSEEETKIKDIITPGEITILDVSMYTNTSNSNSLRALVIGLVSQKLFEERMTSRKIEEYNSVKESLQYIVGRTEKKEEMPLVWLFVDEAHEFLPKKGKTPASQALITLLREGRQPGISLVLASQQPGQIHTDVLTQSDIVISHRLTAKIDIEALGLLMQSYMRQGLDKEVNNLPRTKGAALIFDDTNERIYPVQIRPRYTWHGGSSPKAIREEKRLL